METKKIAIFASGSGTNAENIINYFQNKKEVEIKSVYTNNPKAYVIERAKKFNIPVTVFNRKDFYDSQRVLNNLLEQKVDFIVLAGFLWLVPESLLYHYNNKIVNIHPALLPKYGGKGMYGNKVHESVIANNEKESGISIHLVNKNYDEGKMVFQAKCEVKKDDTPEELARRIHQLEYQYYPRVIEDLILK